MGAGAICAPMQRDIRVLLLGLDNSGKTQLLYQMKLGESVMTISTIGFNVESVNHKRYVMTIWDVGGQDKLRPLWRHYTTSTQCLMWAVDSSDQAPLELSQTTLHELLATNRDMDGLPLLVLANKQDLPGALQPVQVAIALDLCHMSGNHPWDVVPTCGITGQGVSTAMSAVARLVSGTKVNRKDNDQRERRRGNNSKNGKESTSTNMDDDMDIENVINDPGLDTAGKDHDSTLNGSLYSHDPGLDTAGKDHDSTLNGS